MIVINPKTDSQRELLRNLKQASLSIIIGGAGTGKTYCAIAEAARSLENGEVDKIITIRPTVASEDIGFLPGDLTEKTDPYMAPIYDNLETIGGIDLVRKLKLRKQLEIAPVAFLRGRTFTNSYVVVDEAQNCTKEQLLMVITRMGQNCRMAITADPKQADINNSGIPWLIKSLELCTIVNIHKFQNKDVVRSETLKMLLPYLDPEESAKDL